MAKRKAVQSVIQKIGASMHTPVLQLAVDKLKDGKKSIKLLLVCKNEIHNIGGDVCGMRMVYADPKQVGSNIVAKLVEMGYDAELAISAQGNARIHVMEK